MRIPLHNNRFPLPHIAFLLQVKLKPKPWLERWERQELKGVSNIEEYLKEKDRTRRELRSTPWEKYDLMKQYR